MIDSEVNAIIASIMAIAVTISILSATIESILLGVEVGDRTAILSMKDVTIAKIVSILHTLSL